MDDAEDRHGREHKEDIDREDIEERRLMEEERCLERSLPSADLAITISHAGERAAGLRIDKRGDAEEEEEDEREMIEVELPDAPEELLLRGADALFFDHPRIDQTDEERREEDKAFGRGDKTKWIIRPSARRRGDMRIGHPGDHHATRDIKLESALHPAIITAIGARVHPQGDRCAKPELRRPS